jgi:hypothetical protein
MDNIDSIFQGEDWLMLIQEIEKYTPCGFILGFDNNTFFQNNSLINKLEINLLFTDKFRMLF